MDGYAATLEDLKSSVVPELELIESRIVGPIKEFQGILKAIRKSITKREHKVCAKLLIFSLPILRLAHHPSLVVWPVCGLYPVYAHEVVLPAL